MRSASAPKAAGALALALAISTGACSTVSRSPLGPTPAPTLAPPEGTPPNAPAEIVPSARAPAAPVPSFAAAVQAFRDDVAQMSAAPVVSDPGDLYDALGLLADALAVAPNAEELGVLLLAREITTDVTTLRALPVGTVQRAGILDALAAASTALDRLAVGPFSSQPQVVSYVRVMEQEIAAIGPEVVLNPPGPEVLRPLAAASATLEAMLTASGS